MGRKVETVTGVCKNSECGKEFETIPSKRKKYCNTICYQNDPNQKRRRRSALTYLYRQTFK